MIGRNLAALIVGALLLAAVAGGVWSLNRFGAAPDAGVDSTNPMQAAPRALAPVGLEIGSDRGPGPYRLAVGEQVDLHAAVELEDGSIRYDAPIDWSSSDPKTASVGGDGALLALASGSVRVRAGLAPLAAEVLVNIEE